MYQIRKAKAADLFTIEKTYAYARSFMARTGNPNQWGTTNPKQEQLVQDIRDGNLYVLEDGAGIHGAFAFLLGEDPTYGYIEGAWHSAEPYGTLHRVASDGSGGVFAAAVAYCRQRISHLRIDTHRDNKVMQHVIAKQGFKPCGIIYLADGSPRMAYDWL